MKFICDENLPNLLINYLRSLPNSQVKSIARSELAGLSDETIGVLSLKEKSIVVTFDRDFLALNDPKTKVIYLRFPRTPPEKVLPYFQNALKLLTEVSKKKGFIIYVTKQIITVDHPGVDRDDE